MNPYNVLGISPDATLEQIKVAFKTKAKQYHPDVNTDEGAPEKFNQIKEAYDSLLEAEENRVYVHWDLSSLAGSVRRKKNKTYLKLPITLEEAHFGTEKIIRDGNRLIEVEIPQGTIPGTRIQVPSSLYVLDIDVVSDDFLIKGTDLYYVKRISAQEYLDSSEVTVNNHIGRSYKVKLNEGFDSTEIITIKNAGLYDSSLHSTGSMIIRLAICK